MESTRRVLYIDEVSAMTGIPESTLRWWRARRKGEGPTSFKVGRRVAYRLVDVEAWLEECRRASD